MCCDFFYPRLGGVEMHIWSLSQCLLQAGHKVIIVTHAVDDRKGIRYMTNGLKVYYCPLIPFVDSVTFPTFYTNFALFRNILIRERVDIVHGHQATSTLMHECLLQARAMNLPCVYTDHSLFGFNDAAGIHLNKLMKFTLSDVSACIAVSHTCRENLVLRASIDPSRVYTIPNAVDTTKFYPSSPHNKNDDSITIVMISRLVYRKGIDLVVQVIPILAKKYKNLKFIIGGEGPKRILLEEMRERLSLSLHNRVTLLGAVPHEDVRSVLSRGDIFLNSSLTESFCIALLEAASVGLFVVSTAVGGVPEVLPSDMIEFATSCTPSALVTATETAIRIVLHRRHKETNHTLTHRVSEMYNWHDIAGRTSEVYANVLKEDQPELITRLQRYYGVGPFGGVISVFIASLLSLYLAYLEHFAQPTSDIEIAADVDIQHVKQQTVILKRH